MPTTDADLLIRGADVVTMDADSRVVRDGAVAVAGSTILAVDSFEALRTAHPRARIIGDAHALVTPGYVNAHQHLTGDRLVHSCIPDTIDSQEAIFGWAIPVHAAHTADDEELSATLAAWEALSNGITCTVEAGTVAHPDRVAAAMRAIGMRTRIGQWGWDIDDAPYAAPAAEVLARHADLLDRHPPSNLVEAGVTLVGHDLMSDELVTGASDLARSRAVGLTFHMSPNGGDAVRYLERTGRRPLAHLDELGVLGPHLLIAHAVHLDDDEVERVLRTDSAIASCPWAYLRLAQGFVRAGRHGDLHRRAARIALGCDSENAGDAVDILRAAALFVGIARDRTEDPSGPTAHDGLALATIRGAEAIGMGDLIGSLEIGKQADIVVHDTSGPQFLPRGTDPVLTLVWATDGRSVSDVVVAGQETVRNGECVTVDVDALREEARHRRDFLLAARTGGAVTHVETVPSGSGLAAAPPGPVLGG